MSDESVWIERAQSAEAKIKTMKDSYESAIDRIKQFKANFGIRERDNGDIVINFDKFVANLGESQAIELRDTINKHYGSHGKAA